MSPETSNEVVITARNANGCLIQDPNQRGTGSPLVFTGTKLPLSLATLTDNRDVSKGLSTIHYDDGRKEKFIARVLTTDELKAELTASSNPAAVQALSRLRDSRFARVTRWVVPDNETYEITPLNNYEIDLTDRQEATYEAIRNLRAASDRKYRVTGNARELTRLRELQQGAPTQRQTVDVHVTQDGPYSSEQGKNAQAWLRGEASNGFTLVGASIDPVAYDLASRGGPFDLTRLHLQVTTMASTLGQVQFDDRKVVRVTLTPDETGYQVTRFGFDRENG